jgi:hypothetical protein
LRTISSRSYGELERSSITTSDAGLRNERRTPSPKKAVGLERQVPYRYHGWREKSGRITTGLELLAG